MPAPRSPKRSLPVDLPLESFTVPSAKVHCPDSLDFSASDLSYEWVRSDSTPDLEFESPFTAFSTTQLSPRWPLEQPEVPLTFRVLNKLEISTDVSNPVSEQALEVPSPSTPSSPGTPTLELPEPTETETTSDEEFFDYDSLDEPTIQPTPAEVKHIYNFRRTQAQSWDNEKISAKKVRAAWTLMAPYTTGREETFEQVLLAARSFNNTSLLSGLARQTMAPEATF